MHLPENLPDHDGTTYDPTLDKIRLNTQLRRVFEVMRHGGWWSLPKIAELTGDPESSISARIRDLRKPKFGGYQVEHMRQTSGTWIYRLVPPQPQVDLFERKLELEHKWVWDSDRDYLEGGDDE